MGPIAAGPGWLFHSRWRFHSWRRGALPTSQATPMLQTVTPKTTGAPTLSLQGQEVARRLVCARTFASTHAHTVSRIPGLSLAHTAPIIALFFA